MASGHVYRANRPNTWLLRPMLQSEDSPCQLGAVHTWPLTDISSQFRSFCAAQPDVCGHLDDVRAGCGRRGYNVPRTGAGLWRRCPYLS
jgi:hypothetical protein